MASKVPQFLQQLDHIEAVTHLSKRVIRILGMNPRPKTLQGTNTYLVGTGPKRVLIDTGDPNISEYQSVLRDVLEKSETTIEKILLTHRHSDHIGGIKDVCKVLGTVPPLLKHKSIDVSFENEALPLGYSYQYLQDGEEFEIEGATFRVIHAPGHTDDHLCFLLKEENAIFCGDNLLGQRSTTFEDLSSYMKSLELIKSFNPDKLYPGHGTVILNGVAMITEYIKHRNSREDQIVDVLKKATVPILTDDIFNSVYSGVAKDLIPIARDNLVHHLNKLEKEKKIYKDEDKWRLEKD